MNFLKKYFISTINVDKFPLILNQRDRGYIYNFILGILISVIIGILFAFNIKPKVVDEIRKLPNFKIENSKIVLTQDSKDNKNKKEVLENKYKIEDEDKIDLKNKYLNYDIFFLKIYPNISNEDYLNINDNLRNASIKDKEEIALRKQLEINKEKEQKDNEGKLEGKTKENLEKTKKEENINSNEDNKLEYSNINKYLEKEALENKMEKEEIESKIDEMLEAPVLILKDSIYLKNSAEKYIPASFLFNPGKTYSKAELIDIVSNNFYKLLMPLLILSHFILVFISMFLIKLIGSIYMSLSIIFKNRIIFLNPVLRAKVLNYSLSGPITMAAVFYTLTIFEYIQGIDIFWISIIIYIVYLEIISRITMNSHIKMYEEKLEDIKQKLNEENSNNKNDNQDHSSYDEIMDQIEEKARRRKEELEKLRKKEAKEEQELKETKEVKEN